MQDTQKPSKSKKIIIIILIIAFIVAGLIGAGAFGIYRFVILPAQIAESANKNVEVLNQNTAKGSQILNDLSNNLDSTNLTQTNTQETVQKIDNSKQDLTDFATTLDEDIEKLNQGSNSDTQSFYNSSKEVLEERKNTFNLIIKVVDNLSCITQKTSDFSTFLGNSNTELSKINQEELGTFTTYSNTAAQEVEKATKSLGELKDCFVEDFSKYYTPEVEADIKKDTDLYTEYAKSLREFATAVEQKNTTQIDTASKKLDEISATPITSLENKNLEKAFTEPAKSIDTALFDLKDQESELDKNLQELKKKYSI
jgi:hypothetical protein